MKPIPWTSVLVQPQVFVLALLGGWMIAQRGWIFWGALCLVFALKNAMRAKTGTARTRCGHKRSDPGMPTQKAKHGVHLSAQERTLMAEVDRYAERLTSEGASPDLIKEVRAEAWRLAKTQRPASGALRAYLQSLPTLKSEKKRTATDLAARVQAELDLLRATAQEVDAAAGPTS